MSTPFSLLIQYRANLNIKDFHASTALIFASKYGMLESIKLLVFSKCFIDAKGNEIV